MIKGDERMIDYNYFDSIQIGLASQDKIREWSKGEVKNQNNKLQNIKARKRRLNSVRGYLTCKMVSATVENIRKQI